MTELTILVSPKHQNLKVTIEPSVYMPNDRYYILGESNFFRHIRSLYEAEKQLNEYIRRYENALKGLKYWKEKSEEK